MRARWRPQTFCALAAVNAALPTLRAELNARPCKKLPGSRQSLFESLDRPALRPLPVQPYAEAEWKLARVHIDSPVEVDGHYSSGPYALIKQQWAVRLSAQVVARFHKGPRVARPQRSPAKGRHSTGRDHMPPAHRPSAEWTPQRLVRWAAHGGPAVAQGVETILAARPHPPPGLRACLGLMRRGKRYGEERLEAACQRALALGACSDKRSASMLKHGRDRGPVPAPPAATASLWHATICGPHYYHPTSGAC